MSPENGPSQKEAGSSPKNHFSGERLVFGECVCGSGTLLGILTEVKADVELVADESWPINLLNVPHLHVRNV